MRCMTRLEVVSFGDRSLYLFLSTSEGFLGSVSQSTTMRKAPLCPVGKDPLVKKFFVQTVTPWQSMSLLSHKLNSEIKRILKGVVRQVGA